MSENMVERVGLAIMRAVFSQDEGGEGDADSVNKDWYADLRAGYLDQGAVDFKLVARAALEAMREPTEEMHDAGDTVVSGGQGNPHDRPLPTLRNAYRAMIDAAIRPGEKG